MGLEIYQKKRKFVKTPEPKGEPLKKGASRFVVQEHQARQLHYDFRLEMDGVLKSWAVPKGMPEEKGIKRLAMQVEDHPVQYLNFSGVIPAGNYGAGTVKIWDQGKYELKEKNKTELVFKLMGKRLKGEYVLIKTKYGRGGQSWLIFRHG